jgi:hypothetical protein
VLAKLAALDVPPSSPSSGPVDLLARQADLTRLRAEFKELSFHQTVRHRQNTFFLQLLESLKPGEAVMTQDYSKWYASDSERVYDLILVLITRPQPCGQLVHLCINNFFTGHHNWESTAGVLTSLIKQGTFAALGLKRIHKVSDTGTGFRQTEMLHWDTVISELSGIEFRTELKAEYHGYSASDQHASVLSRIFDDLRTSSKLVGVEQFAAAVRHYREGSTPQTIAFSYEPNPGAKDIVIQTIANSMCHRKPAILIRQFHSFWPYHDESGKLVPGVVTASRLSGEKHTAVFDMRPAVATCDICSCVKMRPINAHGRGRRCPSATTALPTLDPNFDDDVAPLSVLTTTTMLPVQYGASLVNRYAKKKPPKRKAAPSDHEATPKRHKKVKEDSTLEEEGGDDDTTSESEGEAGADVLIPLAIVDELWLPLPEDGKYDRFTHSQRRYVVTFQYGTDVVVENILAEDTDPTPAIQVNIDTHQLADDPLNPFYDKLKAKWRRIHPHPPPQPDNPKRHKAKKKGKGGGRLS